MQIFDSATGEFITEVNTWVEADAYCLTMWEDYGVRCVVK